MQEIKQFTLFGLRCSGTSFLQHAIAENFEIPHTWDYGYKHFFKQTGFSGDNTLNLVIVRHPVDWLNSFFKHPHHIATKCRETKEAFLNDPIFSTYMSGKGKQGRDMVEDYHIGENRRYKNVFELRYNKLDNRYHELAQNVKHYHWIVYEDLRDNYQREIQKIADKFNLSLKHGKIVPITKYKGSGAEFVKQEYDAITLMEVYEKLDLEKELKYGYDLKAEIKKMI